MYKGIALRIFAGCCMYCYDINDIIVSILDLQSLLYHGAHLEDTI
jgi:hypothetical protein